MKKLLLILLLTLPLLAQELTLKEGFVAAHTEMLMDSTIDPLNTALEAKVSMEADDITTLKGRFWIDMGLFYSDNEDRDAHMDEANEISKFPLAAYELTGVSKNYKGDNYTLHGTLDFHGTKNPFTAQAQLVQDEKGVTLSAKGQLLASEYNLEMPCLLFMCVRDEVDIFVKAVLVK